MFYLQWTNVDSPSESFATLAEAIARGMRGGFEFSVWNGQDRVASWSVFGGLRQYK